MAEGLGLASVGVATGKVFDRGDTGGGAEAARRHVDRYLIETRPLASCTLGIIHRQKVWLQQLSAVTGLALMCLPMVLVRVLPWLAFSLFAVVILFRLLLVGAGVFLRRDEGAARGGREVEDRQIWPVYTVLVPVFREPEVVGTLISALTGLDYPADQLDIQILLEEVDDQTRSALDSLSLAPHFTVVIVPKGEIQTKPRALNYGLARARGQYVAIYDAEDQMHFSQLKSAVRAFQRDRNNSAKRPLACVQAPLIPHNGDDSWIARQFELEYAAQFGLIVPGLTALECPVLLGGTSNHFDKEILEAVGGWDPCNVTEDADLGLRLARDGYRVGLISPPTFEEAPVRCRQWVFQRSRWIKGFIQTLGVFLREPDEAVRAMGVLRWLSALALLGGAIASALLHGPLAVLLLALALVPGWTPPGEAIVLLLSGFSVHILTSFLSMGQITFSRVFGVLTAPLYWPLQTLAACKAVRELFIDPYFWEKTEHGVTRYELDNSKLQA